MTINGPGHEPPGHEPPGDEDAPVLGGLHRWLNRLRRTRTGRISVRVVISVLGVLVIAGGIALIPLPGPGWAIVIGGLAILALEYVWAHHLMRFTKRQVTAWALWVTRQALWLRLVIGVAGFGFVAAVVWVSLKTTMGFDYLVWGRHVLGW